MNPAVGYASPYVPPEWITAHGCTPVKVSPPASPLGGAVARLSGLCPYARSLANDLGGREDLDAFVMAATCDQMRRSMELVDEARFPIFLLHVPRTVGDAAVALYAAELKRLSLFLMASGGSAPTANAIQRSVASHGHEEHAVTPGVPVALVGGPLLVEHRSIRDLIAAAGGRVVLDATDDGVRTQPAELDPGLLLESPEMALAKAYLEVIADAFRRPNDALYEWLRLGLRESGARGIVLLRYLWCDIWHAEAARLRETFPLPLLDLDADEGQDLSRLAMRIESFVETLR